MRLVLIRHGQTAANVSGALDTALPGSPLNTRGLKQAQALPGKYQELVGQPPSRLVTSPIGRAVETGEPLARAYGLKSNPDPRLAEVSAGELEMSISPADTQLYLEVIMSWIDGSDLDRRMPQAESGREILSRFDAAINDLCSAQHEDSTVVAVLHGAIMRVWAAHRVANLSADLLGQHPCANTGITLLEGHPQRGWQAQLWSDRPVDSWEVTPGALPRSSRQAVLDLDE